MVSGSVKVAFDSFFSYAASDQVMIHGQTWQHDGLLISFLLWMKFRDSAALNVKIESSAGDHTLDAASMKCSLLCFNSVVGHK